MTYLELDNILKKKSRKKIYNHTYVIRLNNDIGIQYYDTVILTFYSTGEIKIDTGGINGKFTKDRINKYLPKPHKIAQNHGNWYLHRPEGVIPYKNPYIINGK